MFTWTTLRVILELNLYLAFFFLNNISLGQNLWRDMIKISGPTSPTCSTPA